LSSEIERSNMRKQELASRLVRTEERVLGLVERGLTAAGITLSSLADSESPSASTLVQTVASVEKLHRIAQSICGDATTQVHTQVNVGTINVSSDLVAAVANAYAEIDKGQLERASALIADADTAADILEGEIVD
jgi:hypothetical protein